MARPARRTYSVFDGRINGERFRTYHEQQLLQIQPGEFVFMDNRGSHMSTAIHQMIRPEPGHLEAHPRRPELNRRPGDYAHMRNTLRSKRERP